MRAILLKADENEFVEVEIDTNKGLEDYYKYLECSCFDIQTVDFLGIKMSLFVDDEATFKSGNIAFESKLFNEYLIGNILFLGGVDSEGNTLELPKEVVCGDLKANISVYGIVE